MQNSFPLQLISKKMVTPTVLHLEFARQDHEAFLFIPGQFITFHFELDGMLYSRSYSIASIASETDNIAVAVSPFQGGPGTRKLFSLEPGDIISTTGPFGRLVLRDEPVGRYILIATGTGVTPYRAMLPQLLERIARENISVVIFLGVKSKAEALYMEDFQRYAELEPRLQFHAFYSREMPEQPLACEHAGYIQTGFSLLNLDPARDIVYLCGNPNMIDQAFETLKEYGFETAKVRREKYISPKK